MNPAVNTFLSALTIVAIDIRQWNAKLLLVHMTSFQYNWQSLLPEYR